MADVYRPTFHRAIPPDAKFVVRGGVSYARFRSRNGQGVEGEVLPDGKRCRVHTRDYYARIKDSLGRQKRIPLGVTDLEAARQLRAKLQREADQRKAGLVDEYAASRRRPLIGSMNSLPQRKHKRDPFGRIYELASNQTLNDLKQSIGESHLGDYAVHLQATGRSATHIWETVRVIRRVAIACGFQFSDDLVASELDRHLVCLIKANKSRRTRNGALKAVRAFVRWLMRSDRLAKDPFKGIATVNESADPRRRHRRALTAEEFATLIGVTEKSDTLIESNSGPMRALLYIVAATTGLRRKELASLTWNHLDLDGDPPFVHVPPASTKAKRDDAPIPLHAFVAKRLRNWRTAYPSVKTHAIFNLTTDAGCIRKTSKMMRLDCEAAGIPYQGDLGVSDFHSHRVAFVTALSRSCTDFSTVVDLARHRDPKLTAKIYDRVRLENRTAAIGSLPMPSD